MFTAILTALGLLLVGELVFGWFRLIRMNTAPDAASECDAVDCRAREHGF